MAPKVCNEQGGGQLSMKNLPPSPWIHVDILPDLVPRISDPIAVPAACMGDSATAENDRQG